MIVLKAGGDGVIVLKEKPDLLRVESDGGKFAGWISAEALMGECDQPVDGVELIRDEEGVDFYRVWDGLWLFVSASKLKQGNLGGTISGGTSHPQPFQNQKQEE